MQDPIKYVITEYKNFAIFSGAKHSDIAKQLFGKPVGAGFCNIKIGYTKDEKGKEKQCVNIHCYGRSVSLGIDNRPEDEDIINEIINY